MTDYDVAVVGGGLLGAGIARDAAQRGLSVALFEKGDFGTGSVSQSSRLALGGLSAIGTLDFTRVREDIREREILLHTAPHLVHAQTCLIPFYSHGLLAQARLRAGLALADALGFDYSLRVHQLLSAGDAQQREPALNPHGLLGAALVSEAAIPQIERLARELAFDARSHGAALHSHTRVEELERELGRQGREWVGGARWKNLLTGETGRTSASLIILAAGAGQLSLADEFQAEALHFVKTVSLVGPPLPGQGDVLVFPHEDDPALLLAVPRPDGCWIGSLSTDYQGDLDAVYATGAEVAALVEAARVYLPDLDLSGLSRAQSAVHAHVAPGQEVNDPASNGGRCEGLVTVAGAGITGYRRIAEEAVDLACRKLGRGLSVPPCRTASTPLTALPVYTGETVEASVEYAVHEEGCLTLRDFLERRTPQSWDLEQRRAHLPSALSVLAEQLDWDSGHQAAEVRAWESEVALGQAFRVL